MCTSRPAPAAAPLLLHRDRLPAYTLTLGPGPREGSEFGVGGGSGGNRRLEGPQRVE
jgi:hypothetical protein